MSRTTMNKTVEDDFPKSKMTRIQTEITIDATREEVWGVVSDLGAIQSYHPGVQTSYYTSEQREGVGATRVCEFGGGRSMEERAVKWRENENITVKFGKSTKMPPFREAFGHMSLEEIGDKTRVTLALEYRIKFGFIGSLLDRFVIRRQAQKAIPGVLAGLKHQLEATNAAC